MSDTVLSSCPDVDAIVDCEGVPSDNFSGMVDVDTSALVENEYDVSVDGDPEDENVVESPGVVMISEEELDGC